MDQQNEGEMMEIDDIWDDEEDRENVRNYGLQPSPPSAEKRMKAQSKKAWAVGTASGNTQDRFEAPPLCLPWQRACLPLRATIMVCQADGIDDL